MSQLATQQQEQDYHLLANEPVNWIEAHLEIEPKVGGRIPFILNRIQLYLDGVIRNRRAELYRLGHSKPVCVVVLKARQEGVSTYGLGYQFSRCNIKSHHTALMAAHKGESAEKLFQKVDLFQQGMGRPLPTKFSNRREIKFAPPHSSSLWVATAGNDDLGRSGTVQDFHGSEMAFWEHGGKALNAVMQCVPDDPDCTVIIESTANGMGGAFYDLWCKATPVEKVACLTLPDGTSDFIAVFLPWYVFDEYQAKVEPDFERTTADHPVFGNETAMAETYKLDDKQLQWRRNTIINKCGSDPDKFKQEYPSNDQEAFLTSGRAYFPASQLDLLR